MKVILFMIAGSMLMGLFFLIAYIWSVRNSHLDDEYKAANSILFEDKIKDKKSK